MIAKKQTQRGVRSRNGAVPDWRVSLKRRLGLVPAVDGVFVVVSAGVIHVFSVINELDQAVTDVLVRKERLVEKDHPGLTFDFHTRFHQGRPPRQAVPVGAEPVFTR